MRTTIESGVLGSTTYWMSDDGGVIRCEQDGKAGVLGDEIRPHNQPVRATPDTFEDVCRRMVSNAEKRELRFKLKTLGRSQREAAREIGIDERTMRRYCSGSAPVPRVVWLAVCSLEPADW